MFLSKSVRAFAARIGDWVNGCRQHHSGSCEGIVWTAAANITAAVVKELCGRRPSTSQQQLWRIAWTNEKYLGWKLCAPYCTLSQRLLVAIQLASHAIDYYIFGGILCSEIISSPLISCVVYIVCILYLVPFISSAFYIVCLLYWVPIISFSFNIVCRVYRVHFISGAFYIECYWYRSCAFYIICLSCRMPFKSLAFYIVCLLCRVPFISCVFF